MCVCVCVFVCEREREFTRGIFLCACLFVLLFVVGGGGCLGGVICLFVCLHPVFIQTRDYSRSSYTCSHIHKLLHTDAHSE